MQADLRASKVASVIGRKLGCELSFTEADDFEGMDGEVDVTSRVHVQVGCNYLIVNAWVDDMTMKSWPERRNFAQAIKDVQVAVKEFPVAA